MTGKKSSQKVVYDLSVKTGPDGRTLMVNNFTGQIVGEVDYLAMESVGVYSNRFHATIMVGLYMSHPDRPEFARPPEEEAPVKQMPVGTYIGSPRHAVQANVDAMAVLPATEVDDKTIELMATRVEGSKPFQPSTTVADLHIPADVLAYARRLLRAGVSAAGTASRLSLPLPFVQVVWQELDKAIVAGRDTVEEADRD